MAKIQDVDIPYLEFAEAAAPGTPASGIVRIYSKADGSMYQKDDAGTETSLSAGASGLVEIDTITRATDGVITFTSIPSTYAALLMVAHIRGTRSANDDDLWVRVGNGSLDTGNNYAYLSLRQSASAQGTSQSDADSKINSITIPAASATSGRFGIITATFYNYAASSVQREMEFRGGFGIGTSHRSCHGIGHWLNTSSAIDQIGILGGTTANLLTGSKATLWGLPA